MEDEKFGTQEGGIHEEEETTIVTNVTSCMSCLTISRMKLKA